MPVRRLGFDSLPELLHRKCLTARRIKCVVVYGILSLFLEAAASATLPVPSDTLWYNGDPNGNGGISSFQSSTAGITLYDDFTVSGASTGGWQVSNVFGNFFSNTFPADVSTANWSIRSGVSAGNGGTIVASGIASPVVVTQTGTFQLWQQYQVEVSGLNFTLTSGTYWLGLQPIGGSANNSIFMASTFGSNSIGTPAGNNANSYFDNPPFGTFRSTGILHNGLYDYSLGVGGTALPVIQQTTRQVASSLTAIHAVNNSQLEVFSNGQFVQGGNIDASKSTVVLTHGWNSSPAAFNELATAISKQHPDVNIVGWNWSGDAGAGTSLDLGLAESRTPNEGAALGLALSAALGTDYSQPIQFMGHSLGTLVNSEAAQVFRSHVSASTPANTQITLFDDAEISNLAPGASTWLKPIPNQNTARTIDNYISTLGNLHTEARNIVLEKPDGMNDIAFHGYPISWYTPTVSGTTVGGGPAPSVAGFNLSVTSGIQQGDISNSYYYGSSTGAVSQISQVQASILLGERNVGEIKYLPIAGIVAAIQIEGHVFVSVEQHLDAHTLLSVTSPIIQLVKHSPSYAWLPITIPTDAKTMLLDFQFDNLSGGDWLSIGINDTLLFALESQYLGNGVQGTSTPLDVSSWAGQTVELFLGLNNVDDANAGGTITVHNIRFEAIPEPSTLFFLAAGVLLLLLRAAFERRTHIKQSAYSNT